MEADSGEHGARRPIRTAAAQGLGEGSRQATSDSTNSPVAPRGDVTAPAARHANGSSEPLFAPGLHLADRTARVAALQDARDAQPISHMTLRIDNADGAEDRIRVDVHGSRVGATINVQDPATAAQLADSMGELSLALEARDLTPDSLRARITTAMLSATDADRTLSARGDAFQSRVGSFLADSTISPSRTRSGVHDERPQQDFTRHRQRRDHQGGQQ